MVRRKQAAAEEEEEHEEEEEEEEVEVNSSSSRKAAPPPKRQRQSSSPAASASASSSSSSGANGGPRYSSTRALKLDEPDKPVGVRLPPPSYKCSPASDKIAARFSRSDLNSAVGMVTRMVVGQNAAAKKGFTGKDVVAVLANKLVGAADAKSRPLLGFIRFHVAHRLRDVFGFALFAGQDELNALAGDKWFFTNLVSNDYLTALANATQGGAGGGGDNDENENDDDDNDNNNDNDNDKTKRSQDELDRNRGLLLIVLSVIMINHMDVSKEDLERDLVKFGFSPESLAKTKHGHAPSIPDVTSRLFQQDYVSRSTKDGTYHYTFGEKAHLQVGLRTVLQFIQQTLKIDLDPEEEQGLLRLAHAAAAT